MLSKEKRRAPAGKASRGRYPPVSRHEAISDRNRNASPGPAGGAPGPRLFIILAPHPGACGGIRVKTLNRWVKSALVLAAAAAAASAQTGEVGTRTGGPTHTMTIGRSTAVGESSQPRYEEPEPCRTSPQVRRPQQVVPGCATPRFAHSEPGTNPSPDALSLCRSTLRATFILEAST